MKLGPRVALVTTLLMAALFAIAATVVLRTRRLDLERDLDRTAREVGEALAAGLEPVVPAEALEPLESRVAWAEEKRGSFQLETLVAGPHKTADATWGGLVEAARMADGPVGKFFLDVPRPVYVLAIPLYNALPGDHARQAVAFLGLKRDC